MGTKIVETGVGMLDWCCDQGRMFAILVFLARFDQVQLRVQETEAQAASERAAGGPPGRLFGGRSTKPDTGRGYAGYESFFDNPTQFLDEIHMYGSKSVRAIDFSCADRKTDGIHGQLVTFIFNMLPSASWKGGSLFDQSPPSTLTAALKLSLLMDKLGDLMRNDSLSDITKRCDVYYPLLDFVMTLGSHPAMAELLIQERYYKKASVGLHAICKSPGGKDLKGKGCSLESLLVLADPAEGNAPALITRLENLAKQSDIMLGLGAGAKARQELRSSTDQITMELCGRIKKVYSRVGSAITTNDRNKGLAKPPVGAERWTLYHKANCLELTEEVMNRHHYIQHVRGMSASPKGRVPYLMKDTASMGTSLPQGIFVKASSDTPGVMKCLVIGPEDTPYENGLFEFDVLAGVDYPVMPPNVHFTGTDGGYADMNPNLHRDGKVCLSLLGTFYGPPESKWQAGKSTILSVLVSIQGMILVNEPWRNEPGNGSDTRPSALEYCRKYTIERMALTVRYALIPWLANRTLREGIWKDVIHMHFKCNGERILKTIRGWAKTSPGIQHFREPKGPLEPVRTHARFGGDNLLAKFEKLLQCL
ncbi:MAG: hypothetical protein M1833_000271 [Piccolia ochrophora]|nr:MAG: hypothetical protein M1833_000271 [Piccolia ochrophora]